MNIARPLLLAGHVAIVVTTLAIPRSAAAEICVGVDLQFTGRPPSRALVESMKRETAELWATHGVRIQWSTTTPGLKSCASLHGSFDVQIDRQPLQRSVPAKLILGSTFLTPDAIAHAPIYIDQTATERIVGSIGVDQLVPSVGHPFVAPDDVGRALGRILAHEMGHVILGAAGHQRRGLMRAVFLPAELVGRPRRAYSLSTAEVARLHQREVALDAHLHTHATASAETCDSPCRPPVEYTREPGGMYR
ncbi:MAG TPA: hypothetical protein VFJ02_21455 [Vicinamibacterales bacterium]|nr:hypothetical protein [Vicinamibacterales bacterium]